MQPQPKVFVTRRISVAGLAMLQAACGVRVWEELTPAHFPETTVWVEGHKLLALTRNNTGAAPFVYASQN